MLKYKSIRMKNFGCYRDQFLSFSTDSKKPITVINAENFKGKTTLLNAFRFALTGSIYGRFSGSKNSEKKIISTFINNISKKEDNAKELYVKLNFEFENKDYSITRRCDINNKSTKSSDLDMNEDGFVIEREKAVDILENIMNEATSRFFLFDAELLSKYEELVIQDKDAKNSQVKLAIENMLGVPRIIQARDILIDLEDGYSNELKRIIAKIPKEKDLKKELEELDIAIKASEENIEKQETKIKESEKKLEKINSFLGKYAEVKKAFEKISKFESKKAGYQNDQNTTKVEINNLLDDAWFYMIKADLINKTKEVDNSFDLSNPQMKKLIKDIVFENECGLCGNKNLDKEKINNLKLILENEQGGESTLAKDLVDMIGDKNDSLLKSKIKDFNNYSGNIADLKRKIKSINKETQNIPQEEINSNLKKKKQHDDIITIANSTINDEKNLVRDNNLKKSSAMKRFNESSSDPIVAKLNKKLDVSGNLRTVLEKSVGLYQTELRNDVQKLASDYFLKVINDSDFLKLKINDNYGLEAYKKDGEKVDNESAGTAAIIAYALITSIRNVRHEKSALVLDAAFERLDEKRTASVLKELPESSSQVILIGLDKDIGKETIFKIYGDKVANHFRIERRESLEDSLITKLS